MRLDEVKFSWVVCKDIARLRRIWLYSHIALLIVTILATLLLSVSCAAMDG